MSHKTRDSIFALDIGTRSVVGLIVNVEDDAFTIVDCEAAEHQQRSMLDGQIHDILEVSKVIEKVTRKLSERNGRLKSVAVAAAGRALKTKRVFLEESIQGGAPLTKDDVLSLELSAVQEAQRQLAKDHEGADLHQYYCVGYSVVNYYLDRESIGSLVDQRGTYAGADVIATFLPRIVVDSLMSALKRAKLKMSTLTLEPIAAINVLIPASMRRLNIALVDIGAGTSDVALTAEGTVTAYGMVPFAGDEITEALSQAFLLDFPIAEEIKRKLAYQQEITFTDILGLEQTLSKDEIIAAIDPEINRLADQICQKIIELNGKPPQAVMLIGGGSQTPLLPRKLAERLALPEARVAVRGTDAIHNLLGRHEMITGPEFVTPVGIAVAARKHPVKYLSISVNDNPVRIFDLKRVHVGDVLLHAGFDMKKLHGRPGLAIAVHVNGKIRFIPGTHGQPPVLLLNGQPAHLDTQVADQDQLTVIPGRDGTSASISIKDIMDEITTLDVYINGRLFSIPPMILVNGQAQDIHYELKDRDEVVICLPKTITEVLKAANQDELLKKDTLTFSINGKRHYQELVKISISVNGRETDDSEQWIQQGDHLEVSRIHYPRPSISDMMEQVGTPMLAIRVTFNDKLVSIPTVKADVTVNGEPAPLDRLIHDGDEILVRTTAAPQTIFSDVFRLAEFDQTKPDWATHLVMTVNGEPAHFQTEIKDGDILQLYWE